MERKRPQNDAEKPDDQGQEKEIHVENSGSPSDLESPASVVATQQHNEHLNPNVEVQTDTTRSSNSVQVTNENAVWKSCLINIGSFCKRTITWSPRRCRYDPQRPPKFTLGTNVLLSFASTATVGNLYYNQPILYKIAGTFDVSFERASSVATLMQAGYATGMVLICPFGDVIPRRPFIILLVGITALMWLGLCLTTSFRVFSVLSFLCGFTTVTPQLILPLVGDMAPAHRRATALSVVVSGLALGILVARVISGLIADRTDWRNVYWFSWAAQAAVFASLFAYLPDYPSKNPAGLNYLRMMGSIVTIFLREPVLVQACIIVFCSSAIFTAYWTTLSFLLSSPPYGYSSVAIGLFGLIGIFIICLGPVYSRYIIEKLVPLVTVIFGFIIELAGAAVGVGIGTFTVAGPIVQAIVIDFAMQGTNIALRTSIYSIDAKAQNRVNTAYMICSFCGQLTGTAVGNRLYAEGGWRYSGGFSIGLICIAIVTAASRGPRETGWVGWNGGWAVRKDALPPSPNAASSEECAIGEGAEPAKVKAESK